MLCVNNPKAEEIKAFCDRVRNQSDIERTSSESEKEGLFTGCYCIHPLTGKKCAGLDYQLCTLRLRYRRCYGRTYP